MSQHHSGEPHDIEALQKHLTEAHILTEAHAPVHDVLSQAGLLKPVEDEYIHHRDHEYGAEYVAPAHEILADRHVKHQQDEKHAIEADFAHKMIDYKTKQSGHEFRLFGKTMVSYEQLMPHVKHNQCVQITATHTYHTETSSKWLC